MTTTSVTPAGMPRGTCCVLLNASTSASPLFSQVTPAMLARLVAAANTQLVRDVGPLYGQVLGCRLGASPTDLGAGEMPFRIVDELPQDPGAVAYHSAVGQDAPFGFLALTTCASLADVTAAFTHEMCETAGDLSCNKWADDEQGSEWAFELCDGVESNSYPIDLADGGPPVLVSDFLLPSFFGFGALAPYTYCQASGLPGSFPSAAFQTAEGGYQVKRPATGAESQVQGMRRWAYLTGSPRPERLAKVLHWSSRVSHRVNPRKRAA